MESRQDDRAVKIEVLEPHGFCAGVTGALRQAYAVLAEAAGACVYCLHELVHNELVVAELTAKGMVFVESLADVPVGATVLFSAHGVSPAVRRAAAAKALRVIDATCPFVARVHQAARAFTERGLPVIVIGKADHAEVKGIVGEIGEAVVLSDLTQFPARPEDAGRIFGLVSQTTMNADDVAAIVAGLRERVTVETMAEVCHATKERQEAVKAFDGDALLVLGSANSSNTKRLCEVARCRTFRAGTLDEVRALALTGIRRLGVTSGASTPETFFREVVEYLRAQVETEIS